MSHHIFYRTDLHNINPTTHIVRVYVYDSYFLAYVGEIFHHPSDKKISIKILHFTLFSDYYYYLRVGLRFLFPLNYFFILNWIV